ncbi:hypothetical protein K458DRAFT_208648 [Lentithecium fluviatile CBS 122367]|uniref:Uncharacterized protein n=1 Tax=Lentithecium fluviatile CBS 122367 TaxID=1168545 RepID=A0A6G1J6I0_9PLEO|nr:hypothetical protein K458DRAFT_208648 [Lentithecium fluviatile CBS 122367]
MLQDYYTKEKKKRAFEKEYGKVELVLSDLLNRDFKKFREHIESARGVWQKTVDRKVPTLFAAATFMGVSVICAGFPSRILVQPLLPWCRLEIEENLDRILKDGDHFRESHALELALTQENISFLPGDSHYVMGDDLETTKSGFISWGSTSMARYLTALPEQLRDEITYGRDPCKPGLASKSGEDVRVVLTQHSVKLLKKYSPLSWKADMEKEYVYSTGHHYPAQKILWLQVVLIDIAVRLLIRGNCYAMAHDDRVKPDGARLNFTPDARWESTLSTAIQRSETEPEWNRPEAAVVSAIAESYSEGKAPIGASVDEAIERLEFASQQPVGSPDWRLNKFLARYSGLDLSDSTFQRLADMLKLRMAFFLAYLAIGPDSSDVYDYRGSQVEMPMI